MRKIERCLDPFEHHGAAFAFERSEVVEAAPNIFGRGRERGGSKLRRVVGKANELKGVTRLQVAQCLVYRRLGLCQRTARHAAGAIENEDQLERPSLERL